MSKQRVNVPAGFTWNHVRDRYEHADGRWFTVDSKGDITAKSGEYAVAATNPETVEQMIERKGKTAPRVTLDDVNAAIAEEVFTCPVGTTLTICVLTLKNGYTVTGESACADPANFDAEIGRRIARDNARQKIWPLLGYELRTKLATGEQS
jgi:hypothetical protein